MNKERERGAGGSKRSARTAIGNQHTARRSAPKRKNSSVFGVEVEMRRKLWLTARGPADNRCLRHSSTPKSGRWAQFRCELRGQIISCPRATINANGAENPVNA